jgi:protein-disulfide isomerase
LLSENYLDITCILYIYFAYYYYIDCLMVVILRILPLLIFTCMSLYTVQAQIEQEGDTNDQQKVTQQEVTAQELLSLLPDDRFLGDPKAPVILIEYFSPDCYYCAIFHKNELAQIRKKYIDTGKLLYVFRSFPQGRFALKTTMLSNCYTETKDYFSFISAVFDSIVSSHYFNNPDELALLRKIAALSNLTEDMFNKCITDEAMVDKIINNKFLALNKLGVTGSPTFFIKMNNNVQIKPELCRHQGHKGLKYFSSIIDKLYVQATGNNKL